jgi:hypothetical protein
MMEDVEGFEEAKRPRVGGCKGCQEKYNALEAKLDALSASLKPLIEFAAAFIESPAGKLQRAMMKRRGGG